MKKSNFAKDLFTMGVFIVVVVGFLFLYTGQWSFHPKEDTELHSGPSRIVNVYDYQGHKIRTYRGRVSVEAENNSPSVEITLDGELYVYFNTSVEVIETTEEEIKGLPEIEAYSLKE